MNKCNYLGNLPCKNYNKKKISDNKYLRYLINGLLLVEYDTTDPDLMSFKDSFTGLMIKKLFTTYNFDNYFLVRNILVQFPEKLIKYLKDDLIITLSKSDDDVIELTKELTDMYQFSFLNKRVKTDDGYKIIKRDINISDIYQAIIELDKKINSFTSRYIDNVLKNKLNEEDTRLLLEMLDDDNHKLFKLYDEQFGFLKDCKIDIIKKLYSYYYQELNSKLKQNLIDKINRYISHQERDNGYEIMSFTAISTAKKIKMKR